MNSLHRTLVGQLSRTISIKSVTDIYYFKHTNHQIERYFWNVAGIRIYHCTCMLYVVAGQPGYGVTT